MSQQPSPSVPSQPSVSAATPGPRTILRGRRVVNLVKVARAQRVLLLLMLGFLSIYIAVMVGPGLAGNSVPPAVIIALPLVYFALWVAVMVQSARMAHASGSNIVLAVIGGIAMILPLVNIILLGTLNSRVTRMLKRAGVRVGFLGVPSGEMAKLIDGACTGCGYDLRGARGGVCPECGAHRAPPIAPTAHPV